MHGQPQPMTDRRTGPWRRFAAGAVVLGSLALLAGCGGEPTGPPPIPATQVTAVDTPPPQYPLQLACADIGGEVVLSLTIGTDGSPDRIEMVKPHRADALNEAALEAVRNWRFNPATRNGQPVKTTIQVPMTFNPPTVRPERCFALDDQAAG